MSDDESISIDADEYTASARSAQRKRVVIGLGALVVVLGVAGAAFAFYATAPVPPDPVRVRVVLHGGVDPAVDGPILRGFERRLSEHGFQVSRDDRPIASNPIEEARRRALADNAATTVVLETRAVAEREGAVAGHQLFRTSLTVRVVPTDAAEAPTEAALEFAYEHQSAVMATASVTQAWLDTLVPDAIDRLYQTAAIRSVVGGEDLPMERMRFQVELRDRRAMVDARRARVEAWDAYRARELEAATHLTDGEEGVRCIGDPSRPWSVIGITPDGSAAIVHEAYRTPIFGMLLQPTVSWTEPPEAVLVVPFDGGEPRPIIRVGDFYGLATTNAAASFTTVALIAGNEPAVLTVGVDDGRVSQRWLLPPGERAGFRDSTADGRVILAALDRSGWALYDGERTIALPQFTGAELVSIGGETHIVGQLRQGSDLGVFRLDGSEEASFDLEGAVQQVFDSAEGTVRVLVRDAGVDCSIAMLDIATRTVERDPLPLCLDDAWMLPDGRLLGISTESFDEALRGAPLRSEVVLVDPANDSVRALTRGGAQNELVYASADGRRVVFSRRMEDWPADFDVELYRRVVCYADIPAR